MNTQWLFIQANLLELAGLTSLLSDMPLWARLPTFLLSHGLGAAMYAVFLWRFLPARYQTPKRDCLAFLFVFQFCMPVLGPVGLSTAFLLALYLPRAKREDPWRATAIPDLPFQAMDLDSFPVYSHGGLVQTLRDAADPDKRLKAVMSSKQMPEKQGIELLRFALKDPVDDVRLLAYSMLDSKEKGISESINKDLKELQGTTDPARQHTLHHLISSHYWEMIYLDLAQGGVRQHMLKQALEHIEAAIALDATASALRGLGRVLLATGDHLRARQVFEQAVAAGLPAAQVSPYLAEIAYLERDYALIPVYLRLHEQAGKSTPNFQPVTSYWLP